MPDVTDSPCVPQDPVVQELQKRAHQITEEGRAQQAEEQAEDNNIVGRLVSTTMPSEFRAVTGAPSQVHVTPPTFDLAFNDIQWTL